MIIPEAHDYENSWHFDDSPPWNWKLDVINLS